MTPRRKRSRTEDPLAAYRQIRKPMPPPERVIKDKRYKLDEERAEGEMRDREGEATP